MTIHAPLRHTVLQLHGTFNVLFFKDALTLATVCDILLRSSLALVLEVSLDLIVRGLARCVILDWIVARVIAFEAGLMVIFLESTIGHHVHHTVLLVVRHAIHLVLILK